MADSILKKVFAPSGMVEPPKKTAAVKPPAPEAEKVKNPFPEAMPVERVKTK